MVNIESMIETIFFDGYNEKICVYAPVGAAEQMLLLPLIESIHTRLPNAMIDVVCGERAHSAYDICPYVRSTFIYNVGGFTLPDIYTEIVGVLKGEYYKTIICAAPAKAGEQFLLWMASSANLVGTTVSGFDSIFSNRLFADAEVASTDIVGSLGTSSFASLEKIVEKSMGGSYDPSQLPKVGVPVKSQKWAADLLKEAGLPAGGFVLAHGVPSVSAAAMTMSAFPASASMDVASLEAIGKPVVVAVPRYEEKAAVESMAWSGEVLTVVVVDTPAKLAALVAASGGVVAANTAALPMASYFMRPAVGIFESEQVAALYAYTGVKCVAASAASSAVAAM